MTDHPGRVLIVLLMAATLATLLLALSPDGGASRQGYALMATGTQNYGPYSDRQVLPAGSWAVPCPTPPPYGGYGFPGKSPAGKPGCLGYWAVPCPTPPPYGGYGFPVNRPTSISRWCLRATGRCPVRRLRHTVAPVPRPFRRTGAVPLPGLTSLLRRRFRGMESRSRYPTSHQNILHIHRTIRGRICTINLCRQYHRMQYVTPVHLYRTMCQGTGDVVIVITLCPVPAERIQYFTNV